MDIFKHEKEHLDLSSYVKYGGCSKIYLQKQSACVEHVPHVSLKNSA